MAKKFYAVKKGRQTGIFLTWDDCKKQVDGFSGAEYKGFMNKEEANAYLENNTSPISKDDKNDKEQAAKKTLAIPANLGEKGNAVAYVDGSYDRRKRIFSYGMVVLKDDMEYHESQRFINNPLAEMHNVAGEIKGAEAAMRYALDHGFESLVIYHDYEGIAKWCLGEWVPKKEGTIKYRNYYLEVSQSVMISFVKVTAHSGDYYNEMADRLAKQALGLI
ncbi:MAG: ribonuclease H family protein [Lachnospiraceae bacterium]|nr:ribonuclease H family protein [Lachnospiraceae bacterium]